VRTSAPLVRPWILLSALWVAPPARAEDPTSKFEQYMDACVEQDHFSGSVLVTRDGRTLFSKGYGPANAEHQVPNTPRTKFRLGSITKQFTAMAVLILQERGKLEVEDPVGKYLDDAPEAWKG
jgi:CubicO group peptidase (beta-lactamase class C family)